MNEDIRQLLVLQDRDAKANRLEAELESIDPERERTRRDSIRTQQVLDQAKQDQRQLEVRRKDLENEVETKKEQILKFSQQQLETKKNVEYQTLDREIDHVREAISEIEEQEMELMEQQDAFKSTLAEANQVAEEAKSGEAKKISDLDEREKNIESELDAMDEERDGIVSKINNGHQGGQGDRGRGSRQLRWLPHEVADAGNRQCQEWARDGHLHKLRPAHLLHARDGHG